MLAFSVSALILHTLVPLCLVVAARLVGISAPIGRLLAYGFSIYVTAVAVYVGCLVHLGPFLSWERVNWLLVTAAAFVVAVRLATRVNWSRTLAAALIAALLLVPPLAVHVVFLRRWPTAVLLTLGVLSFPDSQNFRKAFLHYELSAYSILKGASWCATRSCREDWVRLKVTMNDLEDIAETIEQSWMRNRRPPTDEEIGSMRVWPGGRRGLPTVDMWGQPYVVVVRRDNRGLNPGDVQVRSSGADRSFESETSSLNCGIRGATSRPIRSQNLDRDLIFENGCNFVQLFDYPERLQGFLYSSPLWFVDRW